MLRQFRFWGGANAAGNARPKAPLRTAGPESDVLPTEPPAPSESGAGVRQESGRREHWSRPVRLRKARIPRRESARCDPEYLESGPVSRRKKRRAANLP